MSDITILRERVPSLSRSLHFHIFSFIALYYIQVLPLHPACDDGGWVRLREGDSKGFLYMVAPTGEFAVDEWTVRVGDVAP